MDNKPYPLPEVCAPDLKWRIVNDDRARVSLSEGIMFVPLKNDIHSAVIRNHEMSHVAFTPRDGIERAEASKASSQSFQAIEDYRVNYLSQLNGVDMAAGYGNEWITETCKANIEAHDDKGCALTLIAYGAIPCDLKLSRETFGKFATSQLRKIASHVKDAIKRNPTFETTIAMAQYVDSQFYSEQDEALGKPEPEPSGVEHTPSPFEPSGNFESDSDSEDEDEDEDDSPSPVAYEGRFEYSPFAKVSKKESDYITTEQIRDARQRLGLEHAVESALDGEEVPRTKTRLQVAAEVSSAPMKIVKPDLATIIEKHGARKYESRKEGCIFYRPQNLTINGKVFRGVNHYAPCAVLIDCSGSMRLTDKQIESIVRAAPASIVASYSGFEVGELWIIANNGRMKTGRLKPPYGGNAVDVPALEWLGKQKGKKIWVCDGGVTGIKDCSSPAIDFYCREFAKRHSIVTIANVERVVELLPRLHI